MRSAVSLEQCCEPVGGDPAETGPGVQVLRAGSVSRPVLRLLHGTSRQAIGLGCGYIDTGSEVIAIVPPGRPRMPNGIEAALSIGVGQKVRIGQGVLTTCKGVVLPGPVWEPRPCPHVELGFERAFRLDWEPLIGRGEGLTPAGDDLVAGYLAGCRLLLGARFEHMVPRDESTTKLSRTLLMHAARGEVPEPVHTLLEEGDPGALLRFGHSSGRWILVGLCLGAAAGGAVGRWKPTDLSGATATQLLTRCRIRKRSRGWLPVW